MLGAESQGLVLVEQLKRSHTSSFALRETVENINFKL